MPAALDLARDMTRPAVRSMLLGSTALTRFGVNGVEAALALDFIGGEYRTANTSTTFADAFTGNSPKLTYNPGSASSSQSTMTQGYGPELVTNGDFSGGDNGDWVAQADWSITGGAASKTTGTQNSLYQDLTGVSPDSLYEITFDVSNKSGGGVLVFFTGSTVTTVSGNGLHTFIVKASATNSRISFQGQANTTVTIDNISVREAPKIVWAPHNLLEYSEDFTQSLFVKDADVQIGTTNNDDPAGGNAATQINVSGSGRIYANTTAGDYFSSVYIKPGTFSNFKFAGFFIDLGVTPPTNSDPNGSIVALPNNWFRVTVKKTGSRPLQIQAYPDNTYVSHTQSGDYQIWGAHVYRSDLGGMAPVPGAATGFETYVPTNGNAEYLPRVGHHVYNGSTWVNEGLLIESEARTNLVTHSNSNWAAINAGTVDENNATGPDGKNSAALYTPPADTGIRGIITAAYTSAAGTLSVYIKSNGINTVSLWHNNGATGTVVFNLLTGETSGASNLDGYGMEDVGNGWWRCFIYSSTHTTQTIRVYGGTGGAAAYNGTDGFYVYGAQHETASTPSSYIPTNNSTVTRGGQSLTVPPAQFGWPTPEYIGPELVADFSTYADQAAFDVDWTRGTGWTFSGGVASCDGTQVSRSSLFAIPLTVGKVFEFSMEVSSVTAGNVRLRNGVGGSEVYIADQSSAGTYTGIATVVGGVTLVVDADANFVGTIDNVSVREINPLSVSIQMDGRMTYADDGGALTFTRWSDEVDNSIELFNRFANVNTGGSGALRIRNEDPDNIVNLYSPDDTYSPGVLVPFNISSRHGSTFVNGAVDGVALTADTTPTALPDLSGTDLEIAKDFMGTIGTFRQFAGDIGDTGLVTATNPSTEPTLSLTFDGTGGSFYNLSWSE